MDRSKFDLWDFMPYLLNQAADAQSLEFQAHYKRTYGLLRTEWRVLSHLGCYGAMTARDICSRSRLHKTKVSRAVAKLEERRYLSRKEVHFDRRSSELELTRAGSKVFEDLARKAQAFNEVALAEFSAEEVAILKRMLTRMARG